jgi:hypothetical protein
MPAPAPSQRGVEVLLFVLLVAVLGLILYSFLT